MKLAISGKGGVGKTTIAAGLIRHFADQGYQVYAVDADPDTSLGMVLGLPQEKVGGLRPIAEMREVLTERAGGSGAFFSLNPEVEDLLQEYTIRHGNILFLKMGTVKPAGTACYCRENTVLKAMVDSLILRHREMVVLDMGAGIEHLTRGTARGVDLMLIVTEPTLVSLQTARTIADLARQLGIQRVGFVGNKIRRPADEELIRQHLPPEEVIGMVPFQTELLDQAAGLETQDASVPAGIAELATRIADLAARVPG